MDQVGRHQGMAGALTGKLPAGDGAQLRIDHGQQSGRRRRYHPGANVQARCSDRLGYPIAQVHSPVGNIPYRSDLRRPDCARRGERRPSTAFVQKPAGAGPGLYAVRPDAAVLRNGKQGRQWLAHKCRYSFTLGEAMATRANCWKPEHRRQNIALVLAFALPLSAQALPGTWSPAGSLGIARYGHTSTLLPSGKILVTGDTGGSATTDIYDPASNGWTAAANMGTGRSAATASLLPSGKVLVAGGNAANNCITTFTGSGSRPRSATHQLTAELYTPAGNVRGMVPDNLPPSARRTRRHCWHRARCWSPEALGRLH